MATSLHHSGGTICEPVDLPVNKRHFDMVYSHMKYSGQADMARSPIRIGRATP